MTGATRWTPGSHHGLVWDAGIALLDGSVDASVAEQVWEQLREAIELRTFFGELADASGLRLLDLPSFAVALRTPGGRANLAARGAFVATASTATAETSVSGEDVTTWREASLEDAQTLRVGISGPAGSAGSTSLPLVGGVVPADLLVLTTEDTVPAPDLEHLTTDHTVVPTVDDAAAPEAVEPPALPVPLDPGPSATQDETWVKDVAEDVEETPVEPVEPVQPVAPVEPVAPATAPAEPAPAAPAWTPPDLGVPISDVPSPARPSVAAPTPAAPLATAPISAPAVPPPAAASVEPDDGLGDHDGHTVLQFGAPSPDAAAVAWSSDDDLVLATVCASGHANPPQRAVCRVCDQPLPSDPKRVPRPAMGRIIASTGETIELTGPVIVGRDPRAARFQGTEMPRLLAMPHAHVSANHLEIRIEGWSVLAVDLQSTNGTFLRRHGQPPVRLPEASHLLVSDDVLDLGHGLHLTFEELP